MLTADIRSAPMRYIKLGPGGAWARKALDNGELYLGHRDVPHELALNGDREAIIEHLIALGRSPGKAKDFAREIVDFYQLPDSTIWITFENGCLYWAQCEAAVEWIGDEVGRGTRCRRTRGPWRRQNLLGGDLLKDELSTRLTKVAGYRQTLCAIEAEVYLRRKLAGDDDPVLLAARAARSGMLHATEELVRSLHWADFETLVDLLLARGGWHRVSALGGSMKDADLLVEHPVSGERVMVQVKSTASQKVLSDYIERFDGTPTLGRLSIVCLSPQGPLAAERSDVTIWSAHTLAEAALRAGLVDWLMQRAA